MHEMYNETMKLQIDHNTGNTVVYYVHEFYNISKKILTGVSLLIDRNL